MMEVYVSAEFDAPARELWEVIGGFNALPDWHPGIAASTIEYGDGGTVRVLETADGARIVERIENVDYHGHAYTYSIVESELPISRYVSTLRAGKAKRGSRARAEFTAEGVPASDLAKSIEEFYRAGFENLVGVLAARTPPPPPSERRKKSGRGRRTSDTARPGTRR